MKIFFDQFPRKNCGLSVYACSLFREMMALHGECEFHTGIKTIRISRVREYEQRLREEFPLPVKLHWKPCSGLWDFSSIPLLRRVSEFKTDKFDVVHITANCCFPWSKVSTFDNVILTVHDIVPFREDIPLVPTFDLEYIRKHLLFQMSRAAHIITVSEFTKREIVSLLHVPAEKITVIPNGPQALPETTPEKELSFLDKSGLKQKAYFLAVGSFYPHKNHRRLIEAFLKFSASSRYSGETLVIVGTSDGVGDKAVLQPLIRSNPHIRIFDSVSSADLAALYRHASGFFQLSLYEGFGIPVIEAMRSGCPVCCTADSAMTEVAKGAAFAVNSRITEDVVPYFSLFSQCPDGVKEKIRLGLRIAEEYSWARTARETFSLYQTVADDYRRRHGRER